VREKSIDKIVASYEYWLTKYKFVQEKYPGCKVHSSKSPVTFSSQLVNPIYTKYNISKSYNTLFIEPYLEEDFEYGNKKEIIQVFSIPRHNRLAHIVYPNDPNNSKIKKYMGKKIIKFTKFKLNLENRNMNDACWNECRSAIMEFIRNNPGMTLDKKHLDPSLEKLLIFS
jgi:hypothetical protein